MYLKIFLLLVVSELTDGTDTLTCVTFSDRLQCADELIQSIPQLNGVEGNELAYEVVKYHETICQNPVPFQEYYRCLDRKFKSCVSSLYFNLIPPLENRLASITYLCDNINNVDVSCYLNKLVEALLCAVDAGVNVNDDYITNVCRFFENFNRCFSTVVSSCGKNTKDIMTVYHQYDLPPACNSPNPPSTQLPTFNPPDSGSAPSTRSPTFNPPDSGSGGPPTSCVTADDMKQCARQLIAQIPQLAELPPSSYDNEIINYHGAICSNPTPAREYFRCKTRKYRSCFSSEILPSEENLLASIDYLCGNINDVDVPCFSMRMNAVDQCAISQMSATTTESRTSLESACRAFNTFKSCYGTLLSSCPRKTGDVMTKYHDYSMPQACSGTRFTMSLIVIGLCFLGFQNAF